MQELLRTDAVMRKVSKMSSGAAARTRLLIYMAAAMGTLLLVLLHVIDNNVLGWVGALILQVAFLLTSVFVLVVLMEHQDHQGYEPKDVERVVNPIWRVEAALRVVQVVEVLYLDFWWLLLVMLPAAAYDLFLRPVRSVDETRLWKDLPKLVFESKIRLGVNTLLFFVYMFAMITSFIGTLF